MEEGHISYLKDRKINLHLALDLLLAHFSESVEELVFDVEKLEVLIPPVSLPAGQRTRSPAVSESQDRGDVEVNDGNSEPVVNSSQLDDFDLTGLASDVKKSNLDGLLAQVENTIDHIEYVRSALQRIVTSVTEAIDIERNYCKSLIKLFTKNGYTSDIASISESRTSLIAQQSMNPDKFFSAQLMSQVISELLANFEGSMLKSAWLKAIDNMVRLAHFHLKALDSFPKEINDGFLPILSRLHHTRESLQDRKVNVAKQDLASRHMVHRVAQRLLKIQAQIAEKRAEIKRYDQLPTNSGQSIEMLSLATNSGKSALQADEDDPLNAITNTSTSTDTNGGAGKLKSYTALSVAVGLESHEERKVRLTARTAELEENEREAKTALDSALKACAQFEATATSDLVSLTNSTNQNLSMDLGQVRSIFLQLAQGQRDGIAHVKTMQYEVHEAWDKVDPAHECLLFYRVDFEAYDRQKHQPGVERINSGNSDSVFGSDLLLGDSGENIVMLADVAPMASFSPSHSELLGQERATLHLRELRGANDTKDTDDFGDLIDTTKKNSPRDGTGNTSGFPSDTATPIRKISPQKSPARLSKVGSIDAVIPEYELKAFGLQSIEKVLYSCSAALYSKKGLGLTQGRLYITKFFVAYQGWPETRLLLRFSDILTFEKSNTLIYIPNAILIKIKSDEYFFGSLIERDNAYNMLMNLWNVATTVYQSEDPAHSYHQSLVYGLQKDSVQELMTGIDSQITQLTEVAAPPTKPTRPVKVSLPEATQSPVTLTATSTPTAGASTISAPASFTTTASPLVTSPVAVKVVTSSKSSASETQQSIQAPSVATVPTPTVAAGPTSTVAAVDFLGAFRKANLEVMLRQTVAHSADDLWRCFFKDAQGFRNFLEVEGDFDIRTSEWVNLPAGQLRCPEDPCKLPFTQSRDFNFLHKRTTMLFIGPKNAPMAQTHYCK